MNTNETPRPKRVYDKIDKKAKTRPHDAEVFRTAAAFRRIAKIKRAGGKL